jgi:hypothetical protein
VQTHLRQILADRSLPWMLVNDYPMLPSRDGPSAPT